MGREREVNACGFRTELWEWGRNRESSYEKTRSLTMKKIAGVRWQKKFGNRQRIGKGVCEDFVSNFLGVQVSQKQTFLDR